jgi:hypothetical protein
VHRAARELRGDAPQPAAPAARTKPPRRSGGVRRLRVESPHRV